MRHRVESDTVNNTYSWGPNALASITTVPGPSETPGVSGFSLMAFGDDAMRHAVVSYESTAFGHQAMRGSPSGYRGFWNTALGSQTLYNLVDGDLNTAVGEAALFNTLNGSENTAVGADCMAGNQTGGANTALGSAALHANLTGSRNVALGANAGKYQDADYGIFLGAEAGAFPGVPAAVSVDHQLHIGARRAEEPFLFGDMEANRLFLRGDTVIVNASDGTVVPNTRAGEELANPVLAWPPWFVDGDMTTGCTYRHASGQGRLILIGIGPSLLPNTWYQFSYTISERTGHQISVRMDLSQSACALPYPALPTKDGTYTVRFRTNEAPGDFVINVASTAECSFTISNPSIRQMLGGTLEVNRSITTPAMRLTGLAVHPDNDAALAGGLRAGDLYRQGDIVAVVH